MTRLILLSLLSLFLNMQSQSVEAETLFPEVVSPEFAPASVREIIHSYFAAKTGRNITDFLRHFHQPDGAYGDVTLGGVRSSYAEVESSFRAHMPLWPKDGKSYPTLVIGGGSGVVVGFTDTKDLLGAELRILASVDFKNGKIVRWMDYWDGRSAPVWYAGKRRPDDTFEHDYHDAVTGDGPSITMRQVADKLSSALSADDARAAAALFAYDATFEDLTIHLKIDGRTAIESYFSRALRSLPYGRGANLVHVVGNDNGGGIEWAAAPTNSVLRGLIGVALNREGQIYRLVSIWDGGRMSDVALQSLIGLSYGISSELN